MDGDENQAHIYAVYSSSCRGQEEFCQQYEHNVHLNFKEMPKCAENQVLVRVVVDKNLMVLDCVVTLLSEPECVAALISQNASSPLKLLTVLSEAPLDPQPPAHVAARLQQTS